MALFLKRKIGDTIHIGKGPNETIITVDKMTQGEVSLGIQAPRSLQIDRGEIRRKKNLGQDEANGNK